MEHCCGCRHDNQLVGHQKHHLTARSQQDFIYLCMDIEDIDDLLEDIQNALANV